MGFSTAGRQFSQNSNKPLNVDIFFDKLLVMCGQFRLLKNPVNSVDKKDPLSTRLSTGASRCGYWL
jgi:hypothetical protein